MLGGIDYGEWLKEKEEQEELKRKEEKELKKKRKWNNEKEEWEYVSDDSEPDDDDDTKSTSSSPKKKKRNSQSSVDSSDPTKSSSKRNSTNSTKMKKLFKKINKSTISTTLKSKLIGDREQQKLLGSKLNSKIDSSVDYVGEKVAIEKMAERAIEAKKRASGIVESTANKTSFFTKFIPDRIKKLSNSVVIDPIKSLANSTTNLDLRGSLQDTVSAVLIDSDRSSDEEGGNDSPDNGRDSDSHTPVAANEANAKGASWKKDWEKIDGKWVKKTKKETKDTGSAIVPSAKDKDTKLDVAAKGGQWLSKWNHVEKEWVKEWEPKEKKCAFIIFLWGSSLEYALGALVLGQSLLKSGTKHELCCVHTEEVPMQEILGKVWKNMRKV